MQNLVTTVRGSCLLSTDWTLLFLPWRTIRVLTEALHGVNQLSELLYLLWSDSWSHLHDATNKLFSNFSLSKTFSQLVSFPLKKEVCICDFCRLSFYCLALYPNVASSWDNSLVIHACTLTEPVRTLSYGPSNWPIRARVLSQPYNKLSYYRRKHTDKRSTRERQCDTRISSYAFFSETNRVKRVAEETAMLLFMR